MIYEAPKITVDDSLLIHIFVCCLLDELGDLSEEQLTDIITETEAVNYYEFLEVLSKMLEKQLVSKVVSSDKAVYSLLPNGQVMSREFGHRVPLSVRERAVEYGQRVLKLTELERSVKCRIETTRNGHFYLIVHFLNEMGGENLMELKIFAPDLEQAKQMRERFYEKPSDIVMKIMNMFIKDSFL